MISKNRISQIRKLHAKKFRDEEGLFLVEGYKCVEMLCSSDFVVEEVFATENAIRENETWLRNKEITTVTAEEMSRVSTMQTPPELLAIARQRTNLPGIPADRRVLALDRISDPGNLGTIIRTADWFGVRHIVCSEGTVSCFNSKVVQSTMGGLFRTQITYTDLPAYLASCGRPVFGALLDGDNIWSHTNPIHLPQEGAILVIGNESRGITPQVQSCVTHRIAIPNLGGTAESLNASVACAILFAEFLR